MKNILKLKSFLVFLLLITASCIARTLKNQINYKDHFNSSIEKYQTNKLSCVHTYSYFTICPHNIYGNITFIEPYINDCDIMIVEIHMNISDITKTHYFHHYRGNMTTSCAINDLFNYTIIGHVYFDDTQLNGTASICNDDCVDLFFDGQYELYAHNHTCHNILIDSNIC